MDDITFCLSDCQRTDCYRHPSNIQDRTIPHSYAEFKGTETCPFAKDINVTINDDTISRKTVIDALWKAMYEYEDKMEKQFIESDDLDIEDWIQHRIFVQNMSDIDRQTILELPSVQPQRWIPVSEALPDAGVEVWVTINGHDVIKCEPGETIEQAIERISKIRWVTQGYWSEEERGWNDPSFGCPLMVQPIAWMPIDTPEPWREQE